MTLQRRFYIRLSDRHAPTGETRHFAGLPWGPRAELPVPTALAIEQDENDEGWFLFYLDAAGEPFTDTWHATLEDAFSQAKFEFNVARDEFEPWPS